MHRPACPAVVVSVVVTIVATCVALTAAGCKSSGPDDPGEADSTRPDSAESDSTAPAPVPAPQPPTRPVPSPENCRSVACWNELVNMASMRAGSANVARIIAGRRGDVQAEAEAFREYETWSRTTRDWYEQLTKAKTADAISAFGVNLAFRTTR